MEGNKQRSRTELGGDAPVHLELAQGLRNELRVADEQIGFAVDVQPVEDKLYNAT